MGAHVQLQSQVLQPPYDSVTECILSPAQSWEESVCFLRAENGRESVHRTGRLPRELSGFRHWREGSRDSDALQKLLLDSGKGDTYLDKEDTCRCCSVPKEKGSLRCPCVSRGCDTPSPILKPKLVEPPGLLLAPHPSNRIHCVLWVLAPPGSWLSAPSSFQLPAGIFVQTTAVSCLGLPAWVLGPGCALPSSSSQHKCGPVIPAGHPPVPSSNLGEGPSPTRAREASVPTPGYLSTLTPRHCWAHHCAFRSLWSDCASHRPRCPPLGLGAPTAPARPSSRPSLWSSAFVLKAAPQGASLLPSSFLPRMQAPSLFSLLMSVCYQARQLPVKPWLFVSPPGSCVHGILQARILEWVATSSSRGSSRPRD
ncbi:uncharacterized protein LOC129536782 [Moschus berezovskii]|uniref:uncharacterized protein LOC129536782 n=1 Tax=Moschus berezovskii TaxID=68408 RepID=UPI0024440FE0|nr:uncharacterized protein LOC129536782 [Moschus berezovskii]